jgi:signal transduction histidine kinase
MDSFFPIDRCADVTQMISHLQTCEEEDRVSLSRELHDNMGGLLVSAVMDLGFSEQNLELDEKLRQRLSRIRASLTEAIDLKREMIETLRPSILDNFGLIEALKWEVKRNCARTAILHTESYPTSMPTLTDAGSITLFRIVQESLKVALRQPGIVAVQIALNIDEHHVHVAVSHSGASREELAPKDLLALCAVAHRAQSIGGRLKVTTLDGKGAVYSSALPLAPILSDR